MTVAARLLLHRLTEKQLLALSEAVSSAIEEKLRVQRLRQYARRRRLEGGREFPLPPKAVVLRAVAVEETPAGQRAARQP